MTEQEFQRRTEVYAEHATQLAAELYGTTKEAADVGETRRYLSLARTAAQECELWLGRAMVAHSSSGPRSAR